MIQKSACNSSVLLQTFNWNSSKEHNKTFYNHISSKSNFIKYLGIDGVWLPPCSKSVASEGYMPLDYYNLDSEYGNLEDLKQCIKIFHDKNIQVYADVILNHRCAEFQNENGIYNVFGGKLPWDSTAIVLNDYTFQGKGNMSYQRMFSSAPNIDHTQKFVQNDLIDWMLWLKNYLMFDGFRLDYMIGIDPFIIKHYITQTQMSIYIGEYWSAMQYTNGELNYNQDTHRQQIIDWIDNSGKSSHAFDITTKGVLQHVLETNEYWRLADHNNQPSGLIGWWKEKSITFLDNHDTHVKSQNLWPFPTKYVIEGYAYILTHPGIPMLFCDDIMIDSNHTFLIKCLIDIRKSKNINNCSKVEIIVANHDKYVANIDNKILVTIGSYDTNVTSYLFKHNKVLIQNI